MLEMMEAASVARQAGARRDGLRNLIGFRCVVCLPHDNLARIMRVSQGWGLSVGKRAARNGIERLFLALGRDLTDQISSRSCLVVAPHQDDETLGCGATIMRKVAAGNEVRVLFAGDGRHSHRSPRIGPDELAARRERESLEACKRLGVPAHCVTHLGLEDTRLTEQVGAIQNGIDSVLAEFTPDEIYVTSALDGHTDHQAVAEAVIGLMNEARLPCPVYEYPVWFWMGAWQRAWAQQLIRRASGSTWRTGSAMRSVRPRFVDTAGYLKAKRHALMAHASQMTKLDAQVDWPTLGEVRNGAFLECFFGRWETFFEIESGR